MSYPGTISAIFIPAMMMGCGVGPLRESPRLPKSGIRVVRGEQRAIFAACYATGAKTDGGRSITWRDDYAGCYDSDTKTVYAEDSCRGAKAAVLHERAHEEGVADPERAGFTW